jgi:hypothetical protein
MEIDWSDKEVVIAAVKQDGYALYYASDSLKKDKEGVMAAVKRDGWALEYASGPLQNDKEVVMAARLQKDPLLRLVARTEGRGRRNLHILRIKLTMRHFLAWLCAIRSRDEAHFDANGEAVMVGRHAIAAKRTFEDMCL